MEDLWSRTSAHFQRAVRAAERLAARDKLKYVTPEHILLGIVSWRNVAVSMLQSLGVDRAQVTEAVIDMRVNAAIATGAPKLTEDGDARELSPDAHQAIIYAREEGFRDGGNYVDDAHLLVGIIRCPETPAGKALAILGVTADGIRSSLKKLLDGTLDLKYFPEEATENTLNFILGRLKEANPTAREVAVEQLHRWVNIRAHDLRDPTLTGYSAIEAAFAMQHQVMQEPLIVEALLAVMEDSEWNVRRKAPLLLGHIKTPAAQESIIRHLRTESDSGMRTVCSMGLDYTPDTPEKFAAFVDCLQDSESQIVYMACIKLGKLGNKLAVEPLRAVLTHAEWNVRFYACDALVRLDAVDSEVIHLLEELAQQPESANHNEMVSISDDIEGFPDKPGRNLPPRTTEYVLELARLAKR